MVTLDGRARRLALLGVVAAIACGEGDASTDRAPVETVDLVVYAAASTRDALSELEPLFERDHAVDVVFNFGSSGTLANQIVAAAKADVFLSADEQEMDRVEAAELLLAGTRRALLSNQLVVIEPSDGPRMANPSFVPERLAQDDVTMISLGNVESVPAGRYAKAWLERRGVWDAVADRVLPGIDVRAALAAVESGGARAGIVYRTDVVHSSKARIVFAVPLEEGPRISYPGGVVATSGHPTQARAFLDFLGSDAARPAFEARGFLLVPAD